MKAENISKALNLIMVIFFSILIISGPIFAVLNEKELLKPLVFGFVLALFIHYTVLFISCRTKKISPLMLCTALSVLCIGVKFSWIYMVRIEPLADYETYFNYAKALSESFFAPDRYVALFPHIFGYSWFLSLFIKIFGAGELLAPVINAVMSCISGIIIFRIMYRIKNEKAASLAYLLWIFCPSQTIYNSLVLSDLFYTTAILAFILVLTELKPKFLRVSAFGILSGFLLRAVNITRPIAAILIIALFIWIFVLRTNELKSNFKKLWLPFLGCTLLVYVLTGNAWGGYVKNRLGEEPASVPGYNIMVGFNMNSLGTWNLEDSALLTKYSNENGASALSAQNKMLDDAKELLSSGEVDFLKLFKNKLITFLGVDSSAVYYHQSVLPDTEKLLTDLCNTFYYMVIILVLFAFPKLIKYSRKTPISVVLLYIIGLTLAQMLVEVAGRYHYSIIPMLIITLVFGLFSEKEKQE